MTASETHVNVSCYGGGNGSINLTVTGPGFPFTYLWNNGETTQDIDSLSAGIYNVTITDDDGCTLLQSVNISQPVSGMNVQSIITNVNCYGAQTGSIAVTVTGQTPPFQYSWSNGAGAATLNNILAGNYILTVIDNNGCQSIDTLVVSQPAAPLTLALNSTNVPCYNQLSGAIDLVVTARLRIVIRGATVLRLRIYWE
jgi:hypothetical protein